jgi:transcriptional regulator with XRE-family HTH domain
MLPTCGGVGDRVIDGRQVPLNRGRRIVELRNLLVLAQKELASVIGIAQSHLSDLERGRVELASAAIHRICAATATPASFFQYSTPSCIADDINFRTHTRMVGAKQQDFVIQAFKEIERISAILAHAPVVRVKREFLRGVKRLRQCLCSCCRAGEPERLATPFVPGPSCLCGAGTGGYWRL